MTSFSTLDSYPWILNKIPLSQTFRHSKALHVSQSFSSSITRELQKETEKEMGSVSAEYTCADILFLCNISLLFDGHKWLRDTRPIPYGIYIIQHFCQREMWRLFLDKYLLCNIKNVRTSCLLQEKTPFYELVLFVWLYKLARIPMWKSLKRKPKTNVCKCRCQWQWVKT